MRIVVLDGYTLNPGDTPWDAVAELGDLTVYDRSSEKEVLERSWDADILVTNKTWISREVIEQLPRLKFISVLATGYNVVDTAAAAEKGIPVSNVPEYSTDSVAQFVVALVLEHCHRIGYHSDRVQGGAWTAASDFCFWDSPLIELAGKTMGVVGFGRIGRRTGALAHALGMNVIAASPRHGEDPAYKPFKWVSIDALFRESDVVSLHCPQTKDNVGFVDGSLLSTMKPTALLVNTARGPLVNEKDLADALNEGRLAGAAVDVATVEPIHADSPLLGASNCIITPHIAWATCEARQRLMQATADNIRAFQTGVPIHVVNTE